ncbi:MAG: hypothetical protein JKY56_11420 [Kofleriaceae bacterium]|nr:hypothetical protein [Kofleriaceae bacterium]
MGLQARHFCPVLRQSRKRANRVIIDYGLNTAVALGILFAVSVAMNRELVRSMSSRAAVATLCVFLAGCIGYRDTKLPANVINGTIGGIGVLAVASVSTSQSDKGGLDSVVTVIGVGLIVMALLGAAITSSMPDPEERSSRAPQLIPAIDTILPPAPPDPGSWPD